ncbi:MAG: ribonuclease III [Deltaproteobacteria bacterium]|nr:ribonuclease III [Deltaproteobacteria bacterium]
MQDRLDATPLYKRLGYRFRDPSLLEQAFRHASYVNERPFDHLKDNERLEFLGDAVLDLAVSHLLMAAFPDADEGTLSKFRATVVDEFGLHQVALRLELGDYLALGKGEAQSAGRKKPSILAGTVEALMGAVYLDAGFDRTLDMIRRLFQPLLERVGTAKMARDFKSLLQEHTQRAHKHLPSYRLTGEEGPPHDKIFTVAVMLGGKIMAEGRGKSKKEAEQTAARGALERLAEEH